jgi:hypothetical protein
MPVSTGLEGGKLLTGPLLLLIVSLGCRVLNVSTTGPRFGHEHELEAETID